MNVGGPLTLRMKSEDKRNLAHESFFGMPLFDEANARFAQAGEIDRAIVDSADRVHIALDKGLIVRIVSYEKPCCRGNNLRNSSDIRRDHGKPVRHGLKDDIGKAVER